jgi:hypothetical protein
MKKQTPTGLDLVINHTLIHFQAVFTIKGILTLPSWANNSLSNDHGKNLSSSEYDLKMDKGVIDNYI